jgi:hypothetical protein
VRALASESLRDGEPDPAGAAGDERDAVAQRLPGRG